MAELAIEPTVATRLFRLDPNKLVLMSIAKDEVWEPCEIKQSVCHHAKAHGYTKPEFLCTCGIWSCKTRAALRRTFPFLGASQLIGMRSPHIYISARVEQWGTVIEHEDGYRSEFARILPESIQFYPRPVRPHRKKLLMFLRQKYMGN